MWVPFASLLRPSKKRPLFLLQFRLEGNISGNSNEMSVYGLTLKISRVLPVPTGRYSSLEDKSMLLFVYLKEAFPLTLLGHSF